MLPVYYVLFGVLAAAAAGLELTKPAETQQIKNPEFRSFRNNYLVVYSLMMGEDTCMEICVRRCLHATQFERSRSWLTDHSLHVTRSLRAVQLGIGYKAHTYMLCISTMVLIGGTSGGCSSPVSVRQ